jgi:hypothetical protein
MQQQNNPFIKIRVGLKEATEKSCGFALTWGAADAAKI